MKRIGLNFLRIEYPLVLEGALAVHLILMEQAAKTWTNDSLG